MNAREPTLERLAIAQRLLIDPFGLDEAKLARALGVIAEHRIDDADLYFQITRHEGWSLEEGIVKMLKLARPEGAEAARLAKDLRDWVGKEIGPIAKPKDIRFGDNLPKTRSGKIMRRLLRSIAKGEDITQDTSTLENPAILEQLKQSL